jgi:subfamily B ATP-binding cassette protein MsbA
MKKLAKLNNNLQTGLGAAERVFSVLDRPASQKDQGGQTVLECNDVNIEFENVNFAYGEEARVLENISFKADRGDVIALVGPSGAGKSTIINLILRFYDPQDGMIRINDNILSEYNTASLREKIALVSQDIMIFDDTVLANIAYGRPDASQDEVMEAAKKAYAHDFIENMPEGYSTRLGENGMSLSGGQRQRIAIARAILKDAPLLLLDEATSALDTDSEKFIQESLAELQQGRTTIVIAHRLSTIRNASNILVLESGQIIESGTHESLIQKKGLYADLHSKIAA